MVNRPDVDDLLVLVADANIEFTIKGLLTRPQALGIRPITARVLPHPERDPGCLLRAPEFLRAFRNQYQHALVIFDREGCGRDTHSREELEAELERRLAPHWGKLAAAVVLDPELEVWLWSDSPHVDRILGWEGREPDLRSWLVQEDYAEQREAKPGRPKEAVEHALRLARKPRSSALYRKLAGTVSFQRCTDPAFARLLDVLRIWFPA